MAQEVADSFVNYFYSTLDTNPAALGSLYTANSTATIEGNKLVGPQNIIGKYQSLGKLSHNIPSLVKDVQLGINDSCLLIFVSGQLKIGDEKPLNFSHFFQLVATGPNQYYVHNEIFRLIYG